MNNLDKESISKRMNSGWVVAVGREERGTMLDGCSGWQWAHWWYRGFPRGSSGHSHAIVQRQHRTPEANHCQKNDNKHEKNLQKCCKVSWIAAAYGPTAGLDWEKKTNVEQSSVEHLVPVSETLSSDCLLLALTKDFIHLTNSILFFFSSRSSWTELLKQDGN